MEGTDIKMKRIAILPVYDSEGVVHKYLEYYIKSLREVVSDLIIVIIGHMGDEGLKKLKRFSSEIYVKENKGYDAAAYKFVFENYLDIEQLNQYDELILANDTCFGPLMPFEMIFKEMEKCPIDFWGVSFTEREYINYLMSHFIVYKKATFSDIYQYIVEEIVIDDNKTNVCIKFEQGLFRRLIKQGFRFDYCGETKNYDNYKAPDYSILEERNPFMKKRCFEKRIYSRENCIKALSYIRDNTDYDITMILDYVKNRYDIVYDIEKEFNNNIVSPQYFYRQSICNQKDIQLFCMKNKDIYIYGTGIIATTIYMHYQEYLNHLRGFIVSNDQEVSEKYLGQKVFKISEIGNKRVGIIVGVSRETTEEIRGGLSEFENVLYLW